MKKIRKIVTFIVVAVIASLMTTTAFAASNPYTDVSKASVGKKAFQAISYLKQHHVYDDLFVGKKFKPYKKITRGEFIVMLVNAYGIENVPISEKDLKKWNKQIRAEYACDKLVRVAKKLGMSITWVGDNTILTRASASQYLKVFIDFCPQLFKPRR